MNKKIIKNKNKIFIYILVIITVSLVSLKMYVLTTGSLSGEKVNKIKLDQAKLKIENEIKQAEVLKLQSRNEILSSIDNLDMREAEVMLVEK